MDPQSFESFWFGAYPAEWDYDMTDALLSVELDINKRGVFGLYFHNSIISFDKNYVEELIQEISTYITSEYGIVYQRDFDKGPGLYAVGVITGLDRYTSPPESRERNGSYF